ncbi:MAG TPA: hypothetical protein VN790_02850 [Steroidobacteraceae bacterium]|nr:hypothetical protein [Steroidobacteraceae bacterium]
MSSTWTPFACATIALSLAATPTGTRARTLDAHCTREDVQSAEAGMMRHAERTDEPTAAAISAEASRALPPAGPLPTELPAAPRHAWSAPFADQIHVGDRLKMLRVRRLLRVFDNSWFTVFFGLDHGGHAGLHLQEQDPNNLPALRRASAPAERPVVRVVPLRSS